MHEPHEEAPLTATREVKFEVDLNAPDAAEKLIEAFRGTGVTEKQIRDWMFTIRPLEKPQMMAAEQFRLLAVGYKETRAKKYAQAPLPARAVEPVRELTRVRRNKPCPCGRLVGGKPVKFKNCCGVKRN